MGHYEKRAQVLLPTDQFATLVERAQEAHVSVGAIIREAIQETLFKPHILAKRRKAVDRILDMRMPTTDWSHFKKELVHLKYGKWT